MPKVGSTKPVAHIEQIGDLTLILGDCLEHAASIRDVALVLTDPPYGIAYKTFHRVKSKAPEILKNDGCISLIENILPVVRKSMLETAGLYIFLSPRNIDTVLLELRKSFHLKNLIVWDKGIWGMGDLESAYGFQYEFIAYAVQPMRIERKLKKRTGDVIRVSKLGHREIKDFVHHNQKPVELLKFLIENSTEPGELVFDPCMGSGSAAVACAQTRRRFVGCEIGPLHYWRAVEHVKHEWQRLGNQVYRPEPVNVGQDLAERVDTGNSL